MGKKKNGPPKKTPIFLKTKKWPFSEKKMVTKMGTLKKSKKQKMGKLKKKCQQNGQVCIFIFNGRILGWIEYV